MNETLDILDSFLFVERIDFVDITELFLSLGYSGDSVGFDYFGAYLFSC